MECKMKYIDKVNAAQMNAALERKAEIARKRRPLQESGYLPSQIGKLTCETRLIDNGHLMRTSGQLNLDNLNKKIKVKRKELGQEFKHVKRDVNGKCIGVQLKYKPE